MINFFDFPRNEIMNGILYKRQATEIKLGLIRNLSLLFLCKAAFDCMVNILNYVKPK